MPICISCAVSRRPNCPKCASLAPLPDRLRVAASTRTMVSKYRAADPTIDEDRRNAAAYALKEELRVGRQQLARNAWRAHDRRTKRGEACKLKSCPCVRAK